MGFTDPTFFQVIGPNDDETGASQISMAQAIGGGATDGQDEATILLQNAHFLWSSLNRCVVSELTTFGYAARPLGAAFFETTSASYVEFAQVIATLGKSREAVTVKVDWIGRVKVEVYDSASDTLRATVETASTSSQSQADVAIDAGTHTDVYYKLYAHRGGAVTGAVYSITILEDAGGLDTEATHGFKKLDDDAANGLEPFDAFLGQGIADNIEAAYTARLRKTGAFWPTGAKPVLASAQLIAWPLSTWRISYGADEIKITMHVTVSDASVKIGAAVYDFYNIGRLDVDNLEFSTVTTGGPKQATLTLDVTAYRGREVMLLLFAQSIDSATAQTKDYTSGSILIIEDTHRVDLQSGHGMTLTAGDRWKLEIGVSPAGGNTPIFPPFPDIRTVVYQSGNELCVWPRYETVQHDSDINGWYKNSYTATVTTIGAAQLHSLRIVETSTTDRASLAPRVHPGHLPSAREVGKPLYVRQRRLFMGRTRCHRSIGGYDPDRKTGTDVRMSWCAFEAFDDSGFVDLGASLIRGYASSKDSAGVLQYQPKLWVHGILQCVSDHARAAANGFDVDVRLKLSSWGGSAWDADVVTSDTETITRAPVLLAWQGAPILTRSGDLVAYRRGTDRGAYHFLNGAIDIGDLVVGRHGLVPFAITITDTETTSTSRLLRIQLQGDDDDSLGTSLQAGANFMRLVAWSVWGAEIIAP